jgi:hypothetical protein
MLVEIHRIEICFDEPNGGMIEFGPGTCFGEPYGEDDSVHIFALTQVAYDALAHQFGSPTGSYSIKSKDYRKVSEDVEAQVRAIVALTDSPLLLSEINEHA